MNTSFYHNFSSAGKQSSSYQPQYNSNFQTNQSAYINNNNWTFNTSFPNTQTNFFDNKSTFNTYFPTNGLNFSNNKPLFKTNNTVNNSGFSTQGMSNPFNSQSNELAMSIEKQSFLSKHPKNQIKMDEEIDIEDEPKSLRSLILAKKNYFNR